MNIRDTTAIRRVLAATPEAIEDLFLAIVMDAFDADEYDALLAASLAASRAGF
jgi:hypothetical protein